MIDTHTAPDAGAGDPVLAHAPHRIGKVTLAVRDLAAVSRFYQDVIGLGVVEAEASGTRLGVGSTVLLELRHAPDARMRSPKEAGLFHTAFLLPSRADLGAWVASIAERRLPVHGASDHIVSEAIYLADPEGNGIEVYADRPSAAWRGADGAITMSTDPLDLPDLLRAGEGRRWSGFPEGGCVGHMHLQVGALAPAEEFYAGLLGFDITSRYPGGTFYGSGGYHHQLATNIWNSRGAEPRHDPVTGLAGFEIVAARDDIVQATRERLARAGHAFAERERGLEVQDPWGIPILLQAAER